MNLVLTLTPPLRTTVEICTAIIAASFPSLKPLFKSLLEGSSARGGHRYGSKYKGYVRDTNGTNRTPNVGTGNRDPDFEMYGGAHRGSKFNPSEAKTQVGITSTSLTGSEESILPQKEQRGYGITKTTQVSVSIRDGDANSQA